MPKGRAAEALATLGDAVAVWVELRMPFEAATLRLALARAHRDAGCAETAELERAAAARGFEEMGARSWSERARGEERTAAADRPDAPVRCVFRLEGDVRTVCFAGSTRRLVPLPGKAIRVSG